MQGWVDLVGLLHTEMVYPSEDGHPSKYWPGRTWVNFVHATNSANHCLAANQCVVINDKSQGTVAKHLSWDGLLYYKFIIQFADERIF